MVVMDTFVNKAQIILAHDTYLFYDEYNYIYPDAGSDTCRELYQKFTYILRKCEILVHGYEISIDFGLMGRFEELETVYWFLYDLRSSTVFVSQLQSLIINKRDLTLSAEDYVLLFYISLQNEEIQNATRDLPLGMIYDMFMPVAAENLCQWKLGS
jgi:hypothetical protein